MCDVLVRFSHFPDFYFSLKRGKFTKTINEIDRIAVRRLESSAYVWVFGDLRIFKVGVKKSCWTKSIIQFLKIRKNCNTIHNLSQVQNESKVDRIKEVAFILLIKAIFNLSSIPAYKEKMALLRDLLQKMHRIMMRD